MADLFQRRLDHEVLKHVKPSSELGVLYGNTTLAQASSPDWCLLPEQQPLLKQLGQSLHRAIVNSVFTTTAPSLPSKKRPFEQVLVSDDEPQDEVPPAKKQLVIPSTTSNDHHLDLSEEEMNAIDPLLRLSKSPSSSSQSPPQPPPPPPLPAHYKVNRVMSDNDATNHALLNVIETHINNGRTFTSYDAAFKTFLNHVPPLLRYYASTGLHGRFKQLVARQFENAVDISARLDTAIHPSIIHQPTGGWTNEANNTFLHLVDMEIARLLALPSSDWPLSMTAFFNQLLTSWDESIKTPTPSISALINHFCYLVRADSQNAAEIDRQLRVIIFNKSKAERRRRWTPDIITAVLDAADELLATDNENYPSVISFFKKLHSRLPDELASWTTHISLQSNMSHFIYRFKDSRAIKIRACIDKRVATYHYRCRLHDDPPSSKPVSAFYASAYKCHTCQRVYVYDVIGPCHGPRPLYGDMWATFVCHSCTSQQYGRPTVALFVIPTQRSWAEVAQIVFFNLALSDDQQDAFHHVHTTVKTFVEQHFGQLCVGHDKSNWMHYFLIAMIQNARLFETKPDQPDMVWWRLHAVTLAQLKQRVAV